MAGELVIWILQVVSAVAFVAAAAAASVRWTEQRGVGNGWAAAAFLSLSAVSLYQLLPGREPGSVELKIMAALVVLFPYFLLRFACSFSSTGAAIRRTAAGTTVGLLVATFLLPLANARSGSVLPLAYLAGLLVAWTTWSGIAAAKLWALGRDAAAVPRRRVRLLSLATISLAIAVAVAIVVPPHYRYAQFFALLLTLISGVAFYVGFAPPAILRVLWRLREQERLQQTIQTLVTSPTVGSLVSEFLPQAADLVGADSLTLLDPQGSEMAAYPEEFTEASPRQRVFYVDLPREERLKVVAGAASPHFGKDELELLRSIGSLAVLSIERAHLYERELESRMAAEATKDALEREIGERREAEKQAQVSRAEAERANKAKSEFLSRMSHELRTPMNSIIGFSQLLEMELTDPQQRESLDYIRKAGRHLLDLINEVLDISRIEADRMSLSMEAVHISEVVTESAELVIPMANDRSISITIDPAADAGMWVAADRQRLKQVLLNLVSNAVKYNRREGQVRISWHGDGESVEIAVADTGPGIPKNRIVRLFDPFDRLGAETSEVEGTGLGLALSKRLVELMEGDISVTSDATGSTFVVTLAAAAPHMPEEPIELEVPVSAVDSAVEAQILYIEDNLANLHLIERVLVRRPNVKLLTAMQGSLGVQLARDHRPNLILLDLHLPDMSGEALLAHLKGDRETAALPVVMVSADATPGQARRMVDEGAADYITKPIDVDRFLEIVDRFTAEAPIPATATG